MSKIAVMGDYDSIYGFAALGLDIFPVTDKEEGGALLHRLVGSNYQVIYMTEQLGEYSRLTEKNMPNRSFRRSF